MITRRSVILGAGAGLTLAGCDRLSQSPLAERVLFADDDLHRGLQRLITDRAALAREFSPSEMSPIFRSNGTSDPGTPAYNALAANDFADWRLQVGGLVERPLSLSLADLQRLPARTQITRHDCVEGWSAIGQWHGPTLGGVLRTARLRPQARYVVFTCADLYNGAPYYESIDLVDAFHPQTILAWGMNGQRLPVAHGAPVRLRVERQLGYKHAKYVMRIDAVDSLKPIGGGRGGFWEDSADYDWYAGI